MITAYASANATPTTAQDITISQTNLPSSGVFYGAGVDSSDPSATFSYTWTLLAKPSASTASLSSTSTQSVTLNDVNEWGNYRLFLIVTNTSTGESSETDPILAPKTAFTSLRVESAQLGLQKPAQGERDWMGVAYEWVDSLEGIGLSLGDAQGLPVEAGGTTSIIGLSGDVSYNINGVAGEIEVTATSTAQAFDITIGLPNSLNIISNITAGGALSVNDESTFQDNVIVNGEVWSSTFRGNTAPYGKITYDGTTFSINRLNQVGNDSEILVRADVPTTTERAGVLKEYAQGNTDCKILSYENTIVSRSAEETLHFKSGANNPTIVNGIEAFQPDDINPHSIVFYVNNTGVDLEITLKGHIKSCGVIGNGSEYELFPVLSDSVGDFYANTYTSGAQITVDRSQDGGLLTLESDPIVVPSKAVIGLLVVDAPQHIGHGLDVDFICRREIGA